MGFMMKMPFKVRVSGLGSGVQGYKFGVLCLGQRHALEAGLSTNALSHIGSCFVMAACGPHKTWCQKRMHDFEKCPGF